MKISCSRNGGNSIFKVNTMPKIEDIFRLIPDKNLLILGEPGEFWTDRARFSSYKPVILPAAYSTAALQNSIEILDPGNFDAVFIAFGLSVLIHSRNHLDELLSYLTPGGNFIAVELSDRAIKGKRSHHKHSMELLYGSNVLSFDRISTVLKSSGLTGIRCTEFDDHEEYDPGYDMAKLHDFVLSKISQIGNSPASQRLIKVIESDSIAPAPINIIHCKKRGSSQRRSRMPASSTALNLQERDAISEKILNFNFASLNNDELLSIAVDIELEKAQEIILKHGGPAILKEEDFATIPALLGLPDDKTAAIIACFKLAHRLLKEDIHGRNKLQSPAEAADYLADMRFLKKEQLRALYLDSYGGIIWDEVIALGSLSKALISPRELLAPALENSASALLIAHNHLSGIAEPSSADIEFTARLEKAAELLKLDLWDHLIISQKGYYSFNEEGKIKGEGLFNF